MQTSRLAAFAPSLDSFKASGCPFRILYSTAGTIPSAQNPARCRRVLILDSSFNPPTKAHIHIIHSAIQRTPARLQPLRVLLLLAIRNADKAPAPASFEHRLLFMKAFAEDLLQIGDQLHPEQPPSLEERPDTPDSFAVDLGLTTCPYFLDKAAAIDDSRVYQPVIEPDITEVQQRHHDDHNGVEQVHLVGFDTLIRILDPQYYPPHHTLESLSGLLTRHRLRITGRPQDNWGTWDEQRQYVDELANDEASRPGWDPQWSANIELTRSEDSADEAVSSTKVRQTIADQDLGLVNRFCPSRVAELLQSHAFYPRT